MVTLGGDTTDLRLNPARPLRGPLGAPTGVVLGTWRFGGLVAEEGEPGRGLDAQRGSGKGGLHAVVEPRGGGSRNRSSALFCSAIPPPPPRPCPLPARPWPWLDAALALPLAQRSRASPDRRRQSEPLTSSDVERPNRRRPSGVARRRRRTSSSARHGQGWGSRGVARSGDYGRPGNAIRTPVGGWTLS